MLLSTLCVPPLLCLEDGCSPKFSRLPKSEDPKASDPWERWLSRSIHSCNLQLPCNLYSPLPPPTGRPRQQQASSEGVWDSSLSEDY